MGGGGVSAALDTDCKLREVELASSYNGMNPAVSRSYDVAGLTKSADSWRSGPLLPRRPLSPRPLSLPVVEQCASLPSRSSSSCLAVQANVAGELSSDSKDGFSLTPRAKFAAGQVCVRDSADTAGGASPRNLAAVESAQADGVACSSAQSPGDQKRAQSCLDDIPRIAWPPSPSPSTSDSGLEDYAASDIGSIESSLIALTLRLPDSVHCAA